MNKPIEIVDIQPSRWEFLIDILLAREAFFIFGFLLGVFITGYTVISAINTISELKVVCNG